MPPYLQPRKLQEIIYAQIANHIFSNLAEKRKTLKSQDTLSTFYKSLPLPIPSKLLAQIQTLQKCAKKDEDLELTKYIFNMLFTFDTQQLIINMPPRSKSVEFSQILEIVASRGKNLKKLHFVRDIFQYERIGHFTQMDVENLAILFGNAKHLVHLQIQYKCTDNILKIIGEQCHQLKVLQAPLGLISDKGIHYLTQRIIFDQTAKVTNDWESRIWYIKNVYPPMSTFASKELAARIEKYPNKSIEMVRAKNPLCNTLLEMDLTGSNITHKGLFALLELVPNLETLTDRLDVDFFEKVYHIWNSSYIFLTRPKPRLKIRTLNIKDKLSPFALFVLMQMCPEVRRLCCTLSVSVRLARLAFFKKVQYLDCTKTGIRMNVNNNANNNNVYIANPEEREVQDYISSQGHMLKELKLNFSGVNELNLYTVLTNAPNLEELHLCVNKCIIWDGLVRHMCLWHLTNISLSKCVAAFAAFNLFKVVPNAREVNIECVWEKANTDILNLGEVIINHAHLQKLVIDKKQVKSLSACIHVLLQSSNEHFIRSH